MKIKLFILKIFGWNVDSIGISGTIFLTRKWDENHLLLSQNKTIKYPFFTLNQAWFYQFKYLPFIFLSLLVIIFYSIQH